MSIAAAIYEGEICQHCHQDMMIYNSQWEPTGCPVTCNDCSEGENNE